MEHDHMVQTLAPKGTNHALYIRPLPRRSRCGQNFLDAHVCDLPLEFLPEDGVAIAQQVARDLLKRKRLPQLLPGPFCGWMGSHIEMKNASTVMSQHQKDVKHLETNGRYGKEIDGDQLLRMILKERAPGLRRRLAAAHHVFADAALSNVDAQLEQFTMDAGCTPSGVFAAHSANQITDVAGKRGSSRVAPPNLPRPEQTEAAAMPGKHRFGSNNGQRRAPVCRCSNLSNSAGRPSVML